MKFYTGLEQLLILTSVLDDQEVMTVRSSMENSKKICGRVSNPNSPEDSFSVTRDHRDVDISHPESLAVSIVNSRLVKLHTVLESYFDEELSGNESPQYLTYAPGQFYRPHRDIHPQVKLVHNRRVSLVLFLSNAMACGEDVTDYKGGGLRLYPYTNGEEYFDVEEGRGNGIAFPSSMMHEVRPVLSGERLAITSWFYT